MSGQDDLISIHVASKDWALQLAAYVLGLAVIFYFGLRVGKVIVEWLF